MKDCYRGEPFHVTTSTGVNGIYVWDGLGNPVGLLVDFSSNVFSYDYDPYGVQVLKAGGTGNGAAQNPYAFKAGINDRASGLVKFGYRWYNPVTGTWTQQDTLDTPLDPGNANRYGFAALDPINNSDPTGRVLDPYCSSSVGCYTVDGQNTFYSGGPTISPEQQYAVGSCFAGTVGLIVLPAPPITVGFGAVFALGCFGGL
jgi:RHS repeat-associated protein